MRTFSLAFASLEKVWSIRLVINFLQYRHVFVTSPGQVNDNDVARREPSRGFFEIADRMGGFQSRQDSFRTAKQFEPFDAILISRRDVLGSAGCFVKGVFG